MASQQVAGQKVPVGPGLLGSTWSDPSVNISLDFLSAGLNPTKTPPTLNKIIKQQGAPPVQLLPQNFGGLNLSSPPHATSINPPANPLMASNATSMVKPAGMPTSLGMAPTMTTSLQGGMPVNQGMMGMNMSMNMGMAAPMMMSSTTGKGMARVGMGLNHSINPSTVPPKQDAFAHFGNFGK